MTLNEYQTAAEGLRLDSAKNPLYALLGLPGEVGEVCSLVAKAYRDGILPDHNDKIKKELGDCMWFLAAIAADAGLSLDEIGQANIDKLTSRRDRGTLQGSGDNR